MYTLRINIMKRKININREHMEQMTLINSGGLRPVF